MKQDNIVYATTRNKWRQWLQKHFQKEREAWLALPKKDSGKKGISYNDAVEEALCFGWIDSTRRALDEHYSIQRFSPRRAKSAYSQPNRERLRRLRDQGLLHPSVEAEVQKIIDQEFKFPADILKALRKDPGTWKNFKAFPEGYKRIRIAYIDGARERPEEFRKRLRNFVAKTKDNKMITGHGGINKYYGTGKE